MHSATLPAATEVPVSPAMFFTAVSYTLTAFVPPVFVTKQV